LKLFIRKKPRLYALIQRARQEVALLGRAEFHQLSADTAPDRYPEVFGFVSTLLRNEGFGAGTILSYGCATGEECFTLRKYLPDATVVGLDIHRPNVQICADRNNDPRIDFRISNDENLRVSSPYDAIFAMSVLCRWPATQTRVDCSRIYPFRRFDSAVSLLDSVLRPGGLLVIYNANFRVTDASVASKYTPVVVPALFDSGFVHLFSVDNRKLPSQVYPFCVFRKNEMDRVKDDPEPKVRKPIAGNQRGAERRARYLAISRLARSITPQP
jgi:SAM-dependent methyltransferase